MLTLLSERFAPTTTSIGFVHAPLDRVAAEGARWTAELQPNTRATELRGPLEALLPRLEPLAFGIRPRMLYVAAGGGAWTAFFDCGANGTDPVGPVHVLAQLLGREGVTVTAQPDEYGPDDAGRLGRQGAVMFELVGPGAPGARAGRSVRSVSVIREGSRFRFDEYGEPQPFEDVERYASRRIRDRLTSQVVEAYCRALGIDPFEGPAYGPRAVLVECDARRDSTRPPQLLTLAEARARLGIVPCAADAARG